MYTKAFGLFLFSLFFACLFCESMHIISLRRRKSYLRTFISRTFGFNRLFSHRLFIDTYIHIFLYTRIHAKYLKRAFSAKNDFPPKNTRKTFGKRQRYAHASFSSGATSVRMQRMRMPLNSSNHFHIYTHWNINWPTIKLLSSLLFMFI